MSFSVRWGTNLFRHIKIHHQTINTVLMFGLRLQKILPLPAGPNWTKPTGTSAAWLVSVRRSVSNPQHSSAVSRKREAGCWYMWLAGWAGWWMSRSRCASRSGRLPDTVPVRAALSKPVWLPVYPRWNPLALRSPNSCLLQALQLLVKLYGLC